MGYEIYDPQVAPRTAQSLVTVKKRGALSLNEAAYGYLGQPETVQLLFNREENRIGIRSVSPTHPTAHRVRKQRGRTYVVSARSFLRYYGILPDLSVRYIAHQGGPLNMVWVDLDEEGVVIQADPRTRSGSVATETPEGSRPVKPRGARSTPGRGDAAG